MAKKKTILPEEPTETAPFQIAPMEAVEPITQPTNREALLSILNSAPQVPLLNNPKIDPQHVMATTFTPAYREFLIQLRRFAENV